MGFFDKLLGKKPRPASAESVPKPVEDIQFVLVPRLSPLTITKETNVLAAFPFPLVTVSGAEVEARLLELRRSEAARSVTPVIIGARVDVERQLEALQLDIGLGITRSEARDLDPLAWFRERREENEELLAENGGTRLRS